MDGHAREFSPLDERFHRLIHLAATLDPDTDGGLQDRVKERFLRAYFTDGEDVSSPEVLRRLALDAGLPADRGGAAVRHSPVAAEDQA